MFSKQFKMTLLAVGGVAVLGGISLTMVNQQKEMRSLQMQVQELQVLGAKTVVSPVPSLTATPSASPTLIQLKGVYHLTPVVTGAK